MQLSFLPIGESQKIKAISGRDETRRHLESLGFIVGETVEVLSENGGNLIVLIKNTQIAIDKSTAFRIVI